jgi:hypothetical protein
MIDMELPEGGSIFEKLGVPYDTLRKDGDFVKVIKAYYRSLLKEGEELWWIDQVSGESLQAPIIKPFSSLTMEEKDGFIVEAMVLFPEIFGSGNLKFERVAAYLVATRGVVSSNIRDIFTAGGQKPLMVILEEILMPKIFHKMYVLASDINRYLDSTPQEHLASYWKGEWKGTSSLEEWKTRLGTYSKDVLAEYGVTAEQLFEKGLKDGGNRKK